MFQIIYADLLKTHDTIISIHISAKLSATLNSANLAAKEFPGRDIQIIDSCAAHAPLGMIVLKAAALNDGKNTKEEILEAVEDIKKKVKAFILPKNLENLSKGGRIGKARSLSGNSLRHQADPYFRPLRRDRHV
jgi:DegV family protein with EDD domain